MDIRDAGAGTGITRRGWVAVTIVITIVAGASTAMANHVFPDSTDDQAFHEEVSRIAGAGCATGFSDGTFRPLDSVDRQQFAAWMNRCGGRAAYASHGSVNITVPNTNETIRSADLQGGAASSDLATGGFVVAIANGYAYTTTPANCPCAVQFFLEQDGDSLTQGQQAQIDAVASPLAGRALAPLSATAVFPVAPEATTTISVVGRYTPTSGTPTVNFTGNLSLVYVPFGPDGDNTLAFEN